METLGRMGRGEQLWLQICIKPINESWREKSEALVRKLIGAKKIRQQFWRFWRRYK